MLIHQLPAVLVALLPALIFLAALVWLDSYKLLALSSVVAVIGAGAVMAALSYPLNVALLGRFDIGLVAFSRYVSPLSEELLKALIVLALVRMHRIGFLVDAAIYGFAVGTGFALAENLYYLHRAAEAGMGTWIVRGFGTALMHGGATSLFAVMALARLERASDAKVTHFVPGFVVAVLLHSGFNHLSQLPLLATLVTMLFLPPLQWLVFERSERSLRDWLGHGFDADARLLELIGSGSFAASPPGRYLASLRRGLPGALLADALCYLRLYTELSLRAKGILMLRENGLESPPLDAETRAKFTELRYLEKNIGATGLRALRPVLKLRQRELWQLYMLEGGGLG
ncbi:MAG TPA: PrsW family glutamic-type intramembrane protease [Caldimonas sp.]|jgi:RsiW-degrading membrane proteinase PrsW (M82 family)|nr:PrsW family glutamic-type intramembrane protease [Caldimonas sp.]HEX4234811.1 PrsW family glutamic-type intramembrane protease [Caldimonas sp.]